MERFHWIGLPKRPNAFDGGEQKLPIDKGDSQNDDDSRSHSHVTYGEIEHGGHLGNDDKKPDIESLAQIPSR